MVGAGRLLEIGTACHPLALVTAKPLKPPATHIVVLGAHETASNPETVPS
jgi:hypothetical protein